MTSHALTGIQFGLLTDEQIRNLGVVEVTESTLFSKGSSKANGAADSRFGTSNRFSTCGTCGHIIGECPGHPGYISLPYPLPHVAFISYLNRMLNVVCHNCSAFLLPDIQFPSTVQTSKKKLIYAYEEAKKARARKRCPLVCPNPECGLPQPTVYIEEPFVKLMWRDDVVESYFGADVVCPVAGPPAKKKRRRSTKEEEPEAATEPVSLTEEERLDRDRRRGEYEFFVKRPWTNWDAYHVLKSISRADLAVLGVNGLHTHPEGFMLLSLLVPAIGVRPTVSYEEGSKRRGFHQLTRKISDIVKQKRSLEVEAANCKVQLDDPAQSGKLPESLVTAIQMFYSTVSHYLIKDKAKIPGLKLSPYAARAHARSVSISQGLNGKNGRYRATLMGKRVDFCMRTVVGPNPNADIDVIGIPQELARRLTVPIRVTSHNRQGLQRLMAEGGVAQVVDERTGNMFAVHDGNRASLPLMDGWVVERFVKDDDYMVINRQPTLHRPSIMGHRVKVHRHKTLRLSEAVMNPYNADCDGDEMNGHVPQTPEARAEVQELMRVQNHIIHPRANKPVMALIQDGLDAGYFLTRDSQFFTRSQAMNLLMAVHYDRDAPPELPLGSAAALWRTRRLPPPARTEPEPLWSGKQLVSLVIPRISLEMKLKNRPAGDTDTVLRIVDGELVAGTLCKQSLGASNGGIIHHVCTYCGNEMAARFISDVKRLLNRYMLTVGFSIGIGDCTTDPAVQAKVDTVLTAAERHVERIKAIAAEMPDDPIVLELAEDQIGDTLKSLLHMVGNVVRVHLGDDNAFNTMAHIVGSKGSVFNMSQTMAAVGQTFVNGARPDAKGGLRILPSAPLPGQPPLSTAEEMRMAGFIRRPYKAGLSMADAFLHNMGGREGLVDTAAKTSRTGYLQRRIVKAMESHHIAHDGSVRDAYQKQYQRWFGHDGLDPMRTLRVTLTSLMLPDATVRERFVSPALPPAAADAELAALIAVRDRVRWGKITNFQTNLSQNAEVYIPFDAAVLTARAGTTEPTAAGLAQAVQAVDALCTALEAEIPSLHTVAHLREGLCSAKLAERRYSVADVRALCARAHRMHVEARIQPGEGVGALTATSTGEPATQMTLNTFHTAGTSNKGMVHGVPRMKELIGASKRLATPVMTLPLKPGLMDPKRTAEVLARGLPHTLLRNVVDKSETVYEPDLRSTHREEDRQMVQEHGPFLAYLAERMCPWVVRYELCRTRAGARSLEPRAIADLIQEELGDTALVLASRVETELWIIRVYLVDVEATVDAALKKSMQTGTTRTATKRQSQRASLSRKRRKFVDLSEIADAVETGAEAPTLPVPLHRIDPHVGRTTHGPRHVIEWMLVRNTQQELLNTVCVCGLPSITDACVRVADRSVVDPDTGEVRIEEEHVIDVRGSNLVDASMLPAVDMQRIVSNDVMAVFTTLGITAASQILFQELRACLGASGSRVDDRLIRLVVSVMTHNGFVMPISRHGLNRLREHGVLAKVTFEETLEQLFEAAATGLYDGLLGVSENTMVGRQARLGSNLSRMVMVDGDGERVECSGGLIAAHSGAGPDTRILTSVVTEAGSEDFEDFDAPVPSEFDVDRLLTTRNVHGGLVQAATPANAERADAGLYQQHFYHRPALATTDGGMQASGAPPLPAVPEEEPPPFRPSSPPLMQEIFTPSDSARLPFRPSSPTF